MATKIYIPSTLLALGGAYFESNLLSSTPLNFLISPSAELNGMPKAFGLSLGILSVAGFWVSLYGMKIGGLRKKFKAMAAKNGEKDTEARYSYPNLYVDGQTKPAKAFNCTYR